MNRRGFLRGILAVSAAPAVIGSGILMPVRVIALPTIEETMAFGFNTRNDFERLTAAITSIMEELKQHGLIR